MNVFKKMRVVTSLILLSPGLGMAADQVPTASNTQVVPSQAVPDMSQAMMMPPMQAWPQMMPFTAPPNYYWAPPPGMVWPMQPQYPAPMAMPPVPWMPVIWVMVPTSAPVERTGAAEMVPASPMNMPEGKISPSAPSPVPVPYPNVAPAGAVPDAKPASASMPAPPALPPTPSPEATVINYGPVTPAPVIKLPLPEAAPATPPTESVVPASGMVEPGKTPSGQSGSAPEVAIPPSALALAEPIVVAQPIVSATGIASPSKMEVDYGPVAPTPVVDLLTLMQPDKASTQRPTKTKKARKPRVSTAVKPRPTVTTKPVKQRMCWTKGIVAPCR